MKNFAIMCVMLLMAFAGIGLSGGVCFAADKAAPAVASDYVQAYYFHATRRCATCTKLEQYSRGSIEANFKDQLKDGTLRFTEVNFDEPENRHFLQDYNLMYRALVLVRFKDGKQVTYKNLDKIWQLVRNEKEFSGYVKTEVETMLKDL
ncbi:MAG: hypothetical protein FJ119_01920 [Deltaproteobacteria bacterium]|nr:hypothetical protein [Deltaproteobacteria bacterium]